MSSSVTEADARSPDERPKRRYAARMPREQRAEQILDAATRLIARDGFAAFTMERVASEAEIAKSVPYAIFSTLEQLQEALLERVRRRAFELSAAAIHDLESTDDLVTGYALALTRFLQGVAEHPDTWKLVLSPGHGMPPEARAAIRAGRDHWTTQLEPVATRLLARTGLDSIDAELAAYIARSHVEYLARLVIDQPDRFPPQRILHFSADAGLRIAALINPPPTNKRRKTADKPRRATR